MYDHKAIERKWRKRWEEEKTFRCDTHDFSKPKFYALDINLLKLESRPIPERDFEFMFYFDIECPAAAPEFLSLMSTLEGLCQEYRYLGSYAEVL